MKLLEAGTRVLHRITGEIASVVRRLPENTAPGREADEVEPVYELEHEDGRTSTAAYGNLEVVAAPATVVAEAPAAEE